MFLKMKEKFVLSQRIYLNMKVPYNCWTSFLFLHIKFIYVKFCDKIQFRESYVRSLNNHNNVGGNSEINRIVLILKKKQTIILAEVLVNLCWHIYVLKIYLQYI